MCAQLDTHALACPAFVSCFWPPHHPILHHFPSPIPLSLFFLLSFTFSHGYSPFLTAFNPKCTNERREVPLRQGGASRGKVCFPPLFFSSLFSHIYHSQGPCTQHECENTFDRSCAKASLCESHPQIFHGAYPISLFFSFCLLLTHANAIPM